MDTTTIIENVKNNAAEFDRDCTQRRAELEKRHKHRMEGIAIVVDWLENMADEDIDTPTEENKGRSETYEATGAEDIEAKERELDAKYSRERAEIRAIFAECGPINSATFFDICVKNKISMAKIAKLCDTGNGNLYNCTQKGYLYPYLRHLISRYCGVIFQEDTES